jgi:hypothetical protein
MTPIKLTFLLIMYQLFVVVLYDKYEWLQKYPKVYEEGVGTFFLGILMILWELDKS